MVVVQALGKAFAQLGDAKVLGVLGKTLAITLLIIAILAFAIYRGLIWLSLSVSPSSSGMAEAVIALLIAGAAGWFLFRLIALGVLQIFADEIVAAVEAKHFPIAADCAKPLPFRQDLVNSLRGMGRTLGINLLALPVAAVLLVTGIGAAAVFLGVNAWLLGRELTDMTWLRHCGEQITDNPVPRSQRILLGLAIAGIMMVPFIGLLAPILGASAGCHLTHHSMKQREVNWLEREEHDA